MSNYAPTRDREPLFSRGGVNFYATTLLIVAYVVAMVLGAIAISAGKGGMLEALGLSSVAVFNGRIWQPVTYSFVNEPSFWFAWSMFIFFFCGRELEKYFGRRAFLWMYAGMVLIGAIAVMLFGVIGPAGLSGCWLPVFAVFAAYAFVNPKMVFCWIPVIWIASVCFAIYALQFLAYHQWSNLLALCVVTGASWLWTKWQRGHFEFKLPVREKPVKPKQLSPDMDALLDKIGREGLHSLTSKERAQLEKARQDLLKK